MPNNDFIDRINQKNKQKEIHKQVHQAQKPQKKPHSFEQVQGASILGVVCTVIIYVGYYAALKTHVMDNISVDLTVTEVESLEIKTVVISMIRNFWMMMIPAMFCGLLVWNLVTRQNVWASILSGWIAGAMIGIPISSFIARYLVKFM